jgi:hypothetical protein
MKEGLARFIVAVEVNQDEADGFEDSLRQWFATKCGGIKFAIRPVILED